MLKKIDKLVLRDFMPPFMVSFMVAVFVLYLQTMWLYIDDIAGKGAGVLFLLEMSYYLILSLIPTALPIGVLLASVMVFGNMAERYELTSFKSAGIPLFRVMSPLLVLATFISILSYVTSNVTTPYAMLKSRSRMYDIKRQKPTLNLEPGAFNDDFENYSIRIGKKQKDNRHISDVMIEDNAANMKKQFSLIRAKQGEMYITDDQKYFVIDLADGHQYQQAKSTINSSNYPFVITKFETWHKTWSLDEFDIDRTDEARFSTFHEMSSYRQLKKLYDSSVVKLQRLDDQLEVEVIDEFDVRNTEIDKAIDSKYKRPSEINKSIKVSSDSVIQKRSNTIVELKKPEMLDRDFSADLSAGGLVHSFDKKLQKRFLEDARSKTVSFKNRNYEILQKRKTQLKNKAKNRFEFHRRVAFALACVIFLFIGAPMGAIVRKGGFGYPLLVAIVFFMLYYMLFIMFKKLVRAGSAEPILAAYMPCLVLFPIGLTLTILAMNDSNFSLANLFTKLFYKWKEKKLSPSS